MRTGFISSANLLDAARAGVMRKQTQMATLAREISTGRLYDVGLTLGAETGRAATLHINIDELSSMIDSNGATVERVRQSEAAVSKLTAGANDMIKQLLGARSTGAPFATIAAAGLQGFLSDVNAGGVNGYVFGGINSANPPLADYDAGPKAAVDAAFLARFGFAQDDPLAKNITAADMSDFLDNQFADLFADPAWGTTWSTASDTPLRNRISTTETLDTSVSANAQAMRRLASAYTMLSGLGVDNLGEAARQAVIDKATSVLGTAVSDTINLGQMLGTAESRITSATSRLTLQRDILSTRIATLEGVDPAEAKVRLDTLSTQVEMSFSLTVKLLQMSILNYV